MVSSLRFLTPLVCALSLFSHVASAQDPEPTPDSAVDPQNRVFGVLPNYRTADDNVPYMPISAHRKLVIATKDSIDYPLIVIGGVLAGLGQITNQHPQFGQGVEGFAHRWGTSYADQFVGNYLTEGFLPIVFHEDPRYFRRGSGRGGVMSRTFYAASRIFVTKTDHGNQTFNFSEIVGNSIAAGVGNAYYPGERHWSDNASRLSTSLATDAVSQILKEFWPDVRRKYFSHRQHAELLPPARTAAQSGL